MTNPGDIPETPASPNMDAGEPTPPPTPAGREENKDARMWGMFAHLAGLAMFVLPAFGAVVGPLVVWLMKKQEYPFVDDQGKESLNFQITMLIYGFVAGLLTLVCIGFILLPAVGIVDLVFLIIGAIKANEGEYYRYPKYLIIRFIK
jgi:hypothetical protein